MHLDIKYHFFPLVTFFTIFLLLSQPLTSWYIFGWNLQRKVFHAGFCRKGIPGVHIYYTFWRWNAWKKIAIECAVRSIYLFVYLRTFVYNFNICWVVFFVLVLYDFQNDLCIIKCHKGFCDRTRFTKIFYLK